MNKKIKTILFEIILIFSSVLIFRSTWTLIDGLAEIINSKLVLYASLIIGLIGFTASLFFILKAEK